ncbi:MULTISPECIES: hypothetical protein [Methylomonas]|uniref:hypothetical protein n=1 Tax=Methylomonas TaxID=416 RepID=UPI001232D690|nr:hypothetical protein [Methylomonas rhizoryzae]
MIALTLPRPCSIAAGCVLLLLSACSAPPYAAQPAAAQRMPNPAVQKCLADGWKTEAVMRNGVPIDTWCLNPDTGQRCLAWDYFRGQCKLDIAPASGGKGE